MGAVPSVLAISRANGLQFAHATYEGKTLRRGAFPQEAAPADTVVVADYSLLTRHDLAQMSTSGRLGLVLPQATLEAEEVARAWGGLRSASQVSMPMTALPALAGVLEERELLTALLAQTRRRLRKHLAVGAPGYLELFLEEDDLIDAAIPLLHEYPSPARMLAESTVQLTSALHTVVPMGHGRFVERVMQYAQGGQDDRTSWQLESLIQASAKLFMTCDQEIEQLDRSIYAAARGVASEEPLPRVPVFRLRPVAESGGQRLHEPSRPLPVDPDELVARVARLLEQRSLPGRNAEADIAEYLSIRAALEREHVSLDGETRVRLSTAGQLLALSAGDFPRAAEHREECARDLEYLHARDESAPAVVADARVAMALAEFSAVNQLEGFASLQRAVEPEAAANTSPAMLCEAVGVLAMLLTIFGEIVHHPEALAAAHQLVDAAPHVGSARAPADIAELWRSGGLLAVPNERVRELAEIADRNSAQTPYRSYFNFTMMLVSTRLTDPDLGVSNFADIMQERLFAEYNHSGYRTARSFLAIHLAARGEFAKARAEIDAPRLSRETYLDNTHVLTGEIVRQRINMAVGNYTAALDATAAGGLLAEEHVIGVHGNRYLPASLMLRGTVHWHEGNTQLAIPYFERALQVSSAMGEWYVLFGSQTPEFREWLDSLEADALPAGLSADVLRELTATPIYIAHTLPALTKQQKRILQLLAEGRSTASIAAELHLTVNTVKSHCQRLYARLGVNSRQQAVLHAETYGLV